MSRARDWMTALLPAAVLLSALWLALDSMRLREVRVGGGDAIANSKAEQQLRTLRGHNLLLLDLGYWRGQLAKLPGVADIQLRRRLPDVLEATLIARRPLAKWSAGGVVDSRGRRYDGRTEDSRLPIFKGPDGRAASMADFYADADKILSPLSVAQLEVDDDGEWRLFLDGGVILYLGRERRRERLRRYRRHAESLQKRFARLRAVDLRYDKGFAVAADPPPGGGS